MLSKIDWTIKKHLPHLNIREEKIEALLLNEINKVSASGHTAYPFLTITNRLMSHPDNNYSEQQIQECAVASEYIDIRVIENNPYIVFTHVFCGELMAFYFGFALTESIYITVFRDNFFMFDSDSIYHFYGVGLSHQIMNSECRI